jgi:hypothetical protein
MVSRYVPGSEEMYRAAVGYFRARGLRGPKHSAQARLLAGAPRFDSGRLQASCCGAGTIVNILAAGDDGRRCSRGIDGGYKTRRIQKARREDAR